MPTTTDHRVDIRAYARDVEADMHTMLLRSFGADDSPTEEEYERVGMKRQGEWVRQWPDESAYTAAESYALDVEHTARWDPQHPTGEREYGNPFGSVEHTGAFSEPEETRLLLTYGGPNVWVTYSHRYGTAELFHSWGREPTADPSRPKTTGHLPSEAEASDRHAWPLDAELVNEFVETFFPHPAEV